MNLLLHQRLTKKYTYVLYIRDMGRNNGSKNQRKKGKSYKANFNKKKAEGGCNVEFGKILKVINGTDYIDDTCKT